VPAPPPEIEPLPDQGTFRTLPNGDVEERGKMFDPSAGENQDYIEVWRRLALDPRNDGIAGPPCLLLECPPGEREPNIHAFVGHIGPHALGIARIASPGKASGARFLAWRETYDPDRGGWRRVCTVGDEEEVAKYLPSVSVFVGERGKPVSAGREWVVLYSSDDD
jgi:hypothetical protein